MLNSTGHSVRSAGGSLSTLTREREVHYTSWRDGGEWLESVYKEEDGTLLGWYHNEPAHLISDEYQDGRRFPLTAPFIGAAVSYDNGLTWDDLGLVLSGGQDTLNLENYNHWFAGGNGDFSVIVDQKEEYFYFVFSCYYRDVENQGVALARLQFDDRYCPVGKVKKFYRGKWQEPGLEGKCTPVFSVKSEWYDPNPDAFWGPSIHWNHHIQNYVILLNRAIDPSWKQEGIYVSIAPNIGDPSSWTKPIKLLDETGWYPELVGTHISKRETDRELGKTARLFIHGESNYRLVFELADRQGS